MAATYLYTPPRQYIKQVMTGTRSLQYGFFRSSTTYLLNGVWHNAFTPSGDDLLNATTNLGGTPTTVSQSVGNALISAGIAVLASNPTQVAAYTASGVGFLQ